MKFSEMRENAKSKQMGTYTIYKHRNKYEVKVPIVNKAPGVTDNTTSYHLEANPTLDHAYEVGALKEFTDAIMQRNERRPNRQQKRNFVKQLKKMQSAMKKSGSKVQQPGYIYDPAAANKVQEEPALIQETEPDKPMTVLESSPIVDAILGDREKDVEEK